MLSVGNWEAERKRCQGFCRRFSLFAVALIVEHSQASFLQGITFIIVGDVAKMSGDAVAFRASSKPKLKMMNMMNNDEYESEHGYERFRDARWFDECDIESDGDENAQSRPAGWSTFFNQQSSLQ